MEAAASQPGYRYVLGSVLNQVLLHQSIIGLEAKAALDKYNIVPDIIIGCAGGGSNLGGLIAPFMADKLRGGEEPPHRGGGARLLPLLHPGQVRLRLLRHRQGLPSGQDVHPGAGFIPSANHAGGLRYHGMSPVLSELYHEGLMEARAVEQTKGL